MNTKAAAKSSVTARHSSESERQPPIIVRESPVISGDVVFPPELCDLLARVWVRMLEQKASQQETRRAGER